MPKRAVVYMGIDPGTINTGVAICKKGKGGKLTLLHLERIYTPKSKGDRRGILLSRLTQLCREYGVNKVILEPYESRPWEKNQKGAVGMVKLVNDITEAFFKIDVPLMLSSPNNKKGIHLCDLPPEVQKDIKSRYKTHQEHLTDAYIHVYYQVEKKGN